MRAKDEERSNWLSEFTKSIEIITQKKEDKIEREKNKTESKLQKGDVDKILNAIEKQRWYFIKNKPDILFDKETGYLWPNLNSFKYVHMQKASFIQKNNVSLWLLN